MKVSGGPSEDEGQTHLGAQQKRSSDNENVAADSLVGSSHHDQVGEAQQRDQHQQGLGRLPVLSGLNCVGRPELRYEDLREEHEKRESERGSSRPTGTPSDAHSPT